MNPALLNYLQQQQSGGIPQTEDMSPMQQPMPQMQMGPPVQAKPYNPFDMGIKKAIESARESLGMTEKQQDKALRRSMLTFAGNIAQQPKQRGFLNNFGAASRALIPSIMAHDEVEDSSLKENNALANQILAYNSAEEARQMQQEDRQFNREYRTGQLEEQKRYHNLLDRFKTNAAGRNENPTSHQKGVSPEQLDQTFNYIDKTIDKLGPAAERGRLARIGDRWKSITGGIQPNKEQAELSTLEKALKGMLFNAWGYRAQAEFKELPQISPDNSVETNKAIIKQLKNITQIRMGLTTPEELMEKDLEEQEALNPQSTQPMSEYVMMRDPETGEQQEVYYEDLPAALQAGLIQAE